MKIYKIIKHEIYLKEFIDTLEVKVFNNKKLALKYFKKLIKESKEDINIEEYCVEEENNYYMIYLKGYAANDSTTIYLEEDYLIGGNAK